ncbi:hypothetical protein AVEN_206717-1 [Araneus ventricosus]|uniref:Uncharacterized protein n=1 Tax=Araneus ventricosus TaxID=182803 RepID=A0A4Y2M9E6_ARAVE|nr:hypothetical protein AVEN_206717-1 [Araneus ventricosus]
MIFRGLKMEVSPFFSGLFGKVVCCLVTEETNMIQLSCIDGFRRRACCASWTSGFKLLKEEIALSADSLSLHIDVDIPLELAQFIASFIAK